jgi:hypothetical protein
MTTTTTTRLLTALTAAILLTTPALTTPALAGPFETANAYYGNKYGVPDFHFTKAEFGNTVLGQNIHLGLEAVVEHVKGATVVYNPATDEVLVWAVSHGSEGDDHNPGVIPNKHCAALDATAPQKRQGGFCDYATSNATLAPSTDSGIYLAGTIPATARECTFKVNVNGAHEHSC